MACKAGGERESQGEDWRDGDRGEDEREMGGGGGRRGRRRRRGERESCLMQREIRTKEKVSIM